MFQVLDAAPFDGFCEIVLSCPCGVLGFGGAVFFVDGDRVPLSVGLVMFAPIAVGEVTFWHQVVIRFTGIAAHRFFAIDTDGTSLAESHLKWLDRVENYCPHSLTPIEHLSYCYFSKVDRLLLALGEVGLEGVAEGHQLVDFGDDAFLFSEGWESYWHRTQNLLV